MTALTDFQTKKHYYAQQPIFLFYFELLADVVDTSGKEVGYCYCVVELLPGVYNETSAIAAFARVKS